jgi:hypothetical protein
MKVIKKIVKLKKNPSRFFLESRFFYFRKLGQFLINSGYREDNNQVHKKLSCTLYINSLNDGKILEVFKRIASICSFNLKVGNFNLPYEEKIGVLIEYEEQIQKIEFFKDIFIERNGNLYLKRGCNELFLLDFEDMSEDLLIRVNQIKVAFWKLADDNKNLYEYYKDNPVANSISVFNFALKGGVYNQHVNTSVAKILSEGKYLSEKEFNFFFSKLNRILGPCAETERAVSSIYKDIDRFSSATLMRLAAFLCEAGDYSRSLDLAEQAYVKDKEAWRKNRYLGLSNFLHTEKIASESWLEQDASYFETLKQNQNLLIDKIKDANFDFHVVGNSPCEVGKNKGELIDSSGLVIRFNSANVEYPNDRDYGRKTNILVLNPRYYETERNTKSNLDLIVVSDGSLYSTKNLGFRLHDLFNQAPVSLIPHKLERDLVSKLEASPSSGLKILYWIYTHFGLIDRQKISGFSLTDQSDGLSKNYASSDRILPIIHNWQNEGSIFKKITR